MKIILILVGGSYILFSLYVGVLGLYYLGLFLLRVPDVGFIIYAFILFLNCALCGWVGSGLLLLKPWSIYAVAIINSLYLIVYLVFVVTGMVQGSWFPAASDVIWLAPIPVFLLGVMALCFTRSARRALGR